MDATISNRWMVLPVWLTLAALSLALAHRPHVDESRTRAAIVETPAAAPALPTPSFTIAIDVDGDGRLDQVRWQHHGEAGWLDVYLAAAGGGDNEEPILRSTTRVGDVPCPECTITGADADGDGRADVLLRDRNGRSALWISDGIGFEPARR